MAFSISTHKIRPPLEFSRAIGRTPTHGPSEVHCISVPLDTTRTPSKMRYGDYIAQEVVGSWIRDRDDIRSESKCACTTGVLEKIILEIGKTRRVHENHMKMTHAVLFQCGTVVLADKEKPLEFDMWADHTNFPVHSVPNRTALNGILEQNCRWWRSYRMAASPEELRVASTALLLLCTRDYPQPGPASYCNTKMAWRVDCGCKDRYIVTACQLVSDRCWLFTLATMMLGAIPMLEFEAARTTQHMRRLDVMCPRIERILALE